MQYTVFTAPRLIVDAEFAAWMPRQTNDTIERLTTRLIQEGCRDAIVVWRGIIIDGHTRWRILRDLARHGYEIPFTLKNAPMHLESRLDVLRWMRETQRARRNMTRQQDIEQTYRLYHLEEQERARQRQQAGRKSDTPGRSDVALAEEAGVKKDQYRDGVKVIEAAPEWLHKRWLEDQYSTHAAARLTEALIKAPEPVQRLVARHADNGATAERTEILTRLHGGDTYRSIVASGYIQPQETEDGSDAVDFWHASVNEIEGAIERIAKRHRQEASVPPVGVPLKLSCGVYVMQFDEDTPEASASMVVMSSDGVILGKFKREE